MSILAGIRERAGSGGIGALRAGPGSRVARVRRRSADAARVDGQRQARARTARRVLRQQSRSPARRVSSETIRASISAGRSIPRRAAFRSTGTRCGGPARSRLRRLGVRRIGVEGNDGYRLYLDGQLLIDNWQKRSYGSRLSDVSWQAGSTHDIRLEYFESTGNARVKLVWDAGVPNDWSAKIDCRCRLRRARATSRSSWRGSRRVSFAIARSSRCPGIRKS